VRRSQAAINQVINTRQLVQGWSLVASFASLCVKTPSLAPPGAGAESACVFSTFAVEKGGGGSIGAAAAIGTAYEGSEMRIIETAAAGLFALAAQILVVATVMI
jgi:hypothetical protein